MPPSPATVAGLLLTGGASRRMGRDKALIEIGGQRLVDRLAAGLLAVADPVLEVGPGWSALPAVREDPPGTGPLAAVSTGAAALRAAGHDGPVIVLAVDMPRAGVEVLRLLAAGGRSLRGLVEAMAARGEVGWVEPEEWEPLAGPGAFADVDTPADLQRLLERP